jgi:hypothetical protein
VAVIKAEMPAYSYQGEVTSMNYIAAGIIGIIQQ